MRDNNGKFVKGTTLLDLSGKNYLKNKFLKFNAHYLCYKIGRKNLDMENGLAWSTTNLAVLK